MQTVLVVDDDPSFLEALSLILRDEGFRVFAASNGREALDRLPEVWPNLVILDLMMPVMSGPATLELMRGHAATADTPVILVSSLIEEAARAYTTQYDTFLHKPFSLDQLMAAVRSLLGYSVGA